MYSSDRPECTEESVCGFAPFCLSWHHLGRLGEIAMVKSASFGAVIRKSVSGRPPVGRSVNCNLKRGDHDPPLTLYNDVYIIAVYYGGRELA